VLLSLASQLPSPDMSPSLAAQSQAIRRKINLYTKEKQKSVAESSRRKSVALENSAYKISSL